MKQALKLSNFFIHIFYGGSFPLVATSTTGISVLVWKGYNYSGKPIIVKFPLKKLHIRGSSMKVHASSRKTLENKVHSPATATTNWSSPYKSKSKQRTSRIHRNVNT